MPEQDKEKRLEGEVSQTSSSDSYVAQTVDRLRQEIEGIGTFVADTQVLKPRMLGGSVTLEQQDDGSSSINAPETLKESFDPTQSITGLRIRFGRIEKLKEAA